MSGTSMTFTWRTRWSSPAAPPTTRAWARRLRTLADVRAGRLPNGVALEDPPDFRALGLRAGDRADLGPEEIRLPSVGLAIDLSRARRWDPQLAAPGGGGGR